MLRTAVRVWLGISALMDMLVWPPAAVGAVTSTRTQQ
jgi:hypothetical protein